MNLLSGLAAKLSQKTSSAFTNVQSMELAGVSVLNALQDWDTGRWSPKNAMRGIFRILVKKKEKKKLTSNWREDDNVLRSECMPNK